MREAVIREGLLAGKPLLISELGVLGDHHHRITGYRDVGCGGVRRVRFVRVSTCAQPSGNGVVKGIAVDYRSSDNHGFLPVYQLNLIKGKLLGVKMQY